MGKMRKYKDEIPRPAGSLDLKDGAWTVLRVYEPGWEKHYNFIFTNIQLNLRFLFNNFIFLLKLNKITETSF